MKEEEIYKTLHSERITFQELMHAIKSATDLFEEHGKLVSQKIKPEKKDRPKRTKKSR